MRIELQKCLKKLIEATDEQRSAVIESFHYSVDTEQLKVENIFVRHFNQDVYFKPKNILNFVDSLISRLEQASAENAIEMLKAIKNLIQYQNILKTPDF
jgi:benzoyl-CoA reductase/2-hydroxyglutaryl-CoA dehydratase subunit BcrC/BadD/HgdB